MSITSDSLSNLISSAGVLTSHLISVRIPLFYPLFSVLWCCFLMDYSFCFFVLWTSPVGSSASVTVKAWVTFCFKEIKSEPHLFFLYGRHLGPKPCGLGLSLKIDGWDKYRISAMLFLRTIVAPIGTGALIQGKWIKEQVLATCHSRPFIINTGKFIWTGKHTVTCCYKHTQTNTHTLQMAKTKTNVYKSATAN